MIEDIHRALTLLAKHGIEPKSLEMTKETFDALDAECSLSGHLLKWPFCDGVYRFEQVLIEVVPQLLTTAAIKRE